jgi:hypothetical protein
MIAYQIYKHDAGDKRGVWFPHYVSQKIKYGGYPTPSIALPLLVYQEKHDAEICQQSLTEYEHEKHPNHPETWNSYKIVRVEIKEAVK